MITVLMLSALVAPFVFIRLTNILRRLHHDIASRNGMMRDPHSGIYSRSAIDGLLDAEMQHMTHMGLTGAVAVIRVHSSNPDDAMRLIMQRVRAEEMVYRYDQRTLCMLLWDVDHDRAARAVARLGSAVLQDPGTRVADVGLAAVPEHASTPLTAIDKAAAQTAPIQTWMQLVAAAPAIAIRFANDAQHTVDRAG